MEELSEVFWNSSLQEIKEGYIYNTENNKYICLICGQNFEEGRIYESNGVLFDAQGSIKNHIKDKHDSVFDYLLSLDKKYTGITEHQKRLMMCFYNGYSDKEIADILGGSKSTIRNYRFNFKEREKQAKITLAILELLKDNKSTKEGKFITVPRTATIVDERFAVTDEEYLQILNKYFQEGLDGKLSSFPNKEKRRVVILKHLLTKFEIGRIYSEKEVNTLLGSVYHDYVTIRRWMIDYGFLERHPDGSGYWVRV